VWYTRDRELPVICRIAEQKLSIEVHSLKLQLDYGARTTEATIGSWKCKVRTYFWVKIQLSVETYCPGLCIYGKRVVDTFLQRIGWHRGCQLWHSSGGLHIPSKHRLRYKGGIERDEPRLHLKVWCLKDDMLSAGSHRFKGNAKWVYTVQRRASSGIICEQWVPA